MTKRKQPEEQLTTGHSATTATPSRLRSTTYGSIALLLLCAALSHASPASAGIIGGIGLCNLENKDGSKCSDEIATNDTAQKQLSVEVDPACRWLHACARPGVKVYVSLYHRPTGGPRTLLWTRLLSGSGSGVYEHDLALDTAGMRRFEMQAETRQSGRRLKYINVTMLLTKWIPK